MRHRQNDVSAVRLNGEAEARVRVEGVVCENEAQCSVRLSPVDTSAGAGKVKVADVLPV